MDMKHRLAALGIAPVFYEGHRYSVDCLFDPVEHTEAKLTLLQPNRSTRRKHTLNETRQRDKHSAKQIAKRRAKNKNKKTHRK